MLAIAVTGSDFLANLTTADLKPLEREGIFSTMGVLAPQVV